jgi:hypothetical protein
MEGILVKWTNYLEFWKERRFTIRGPILSYYIPEDLSNKPKRRIFLGLAEIIDTVSDKDGEDEDFEFEIDTGAEHYYIRAKDKEEKQKWLNGLKNWKLLIEKLLRESNKNQKNDGGNKKFEQFKKIYHEKIKGGVYKNIKQFQIVLKQFDNIINFIEGKGKLELYKVIYKNKQKNNDNNKNVIINESVSSAISINSKKSNNGNLIDSNDNNNKLKNAKNIKNQKLGRLTYVPKNIEKKVTEIQPKGRLTVSVNNNFTDRGYLLKGEEFFDMDESFTSANLNKEQKISIQNKPNKNKGTVVAGAQTNQKKNIINKNIIKTTTKSKGMYYDPLYSYERRTSLPAQYKDVPFNIIKIIKDAIGKDINHFAMPVFLNEPLSLLQKFCENFQYADLLNKAAEEQNPYLRLAYVACFNIGGFSMNIHRAKKLFNPLLFETYEYIDNNLDYRYFAEQVSHHPAISAFYAEGKGWNIYFNSNSKVIISLRGVEVKSLEKTYVNLTNLNDEIVYTKPMTKVRNVFTDPTLDFSDKFTVKNNEGDECVIHMIPYSESNVVGKLYGDIKDIEGNVMFKIEGNWYDKIKVINPKNKEEKIIWEIIKSCDKSNYFFQPYSFDLNNLTEEMKKVLPRTDSRFRGDQRLMEYQKIDEAGEEKLRLEEKQRKKRKENEKAGIIPVPRYFEETYDDITGELIYRYKGNYFEDRKNHNFDDLPDIFGPS